MQAGLSSRPETFFFMYFVVYVLAVVYISIGMFLAAAMPTFEGEGEGRESGRGGKEGVELILVNFHCK